MNRARGFTLIETMITVVVAGIIMAFGIPAFLGFQKSLAHVQARERLIQDIRTARQVAVTRHQRVIMAFGTPPATTNLTRYSTLVDADGDGVRDANEWVLERQLPSGATLEQVNLTPTDSLLFDPSGALRPGTSGGVLISGNGRGKADTLYISGVGMVFQR